MSLSPKDMDFIEARHVAAREIALALGVPPMLLGIPGDNTYSNMAEAQRIFWRQTVLPLVDRIAKALSLWLAHAHAPDASVPGFSLAPAHTSREPLRLVPDTDALEALSPERDALWSRLEKTTFLTPDEKRAAIGYGPLPPSKKSPVSSPGRTSKFSSDQPRIPAGQPGGGQWTDGDDDLVSTLIANIGAAIAAAFASPSSEEESPPPNEIFDDTEPRTPSEIDDLVHPAAGRGGKRPPLFGGPQQPPPPPGHNNPPGPIPIPPIIPPPGGALESPDRPSWSLDHDLPDFLRQKPGSGSLTGDADALTPAERNFANEMRNLGNHVEIIPRADGIRTPDLRINGTQYELKTVSGVQRTDPDGLSGAISNRILNGRGQAADIVVDAREQAGMTSGVATRSVVRAYGADSKETIQTITIISNNGVVYVPRRK